MIKQNNSILYRLTPPLYLHNNLHVANNSRIIYYDIARIIACFLVIVNHTNSSIFIYNNISALWFVSLTYFYLSKIAVPIFIMISGSLILSKQDTYPTLIKRILRIVFALIIFSYIYYANSVNFNITELINIKKFLILIIHQPVTNAFWYLYLYISLLIMSPFIQRMVSNFSKKDFKYFFILGFVLFGIYPIINHYNKEIYYSGHMIFPLFHAYIVYFIFGYYFNTIKMSKKYFNISIILFILSIILLVLLTYNEYIKQKGAIGVVTYLWFDNLQIITVMIESISAMYIIKYMSCNIKFNINITTLISRVGKYTFGIYLLSDFFIFKTGIIYDFLRQYINPIFAVFIWEILIFIFGLIITYFLYKISVFRKIL